MLSRAASFNRALTEPDSSEESSDSIHFPANGNPSPKMTAPP